MGRVTFFACNAGQCQDADNDSSQNAIKKQSEIIAVKFRENTLIMPMMPATTRIITPPRNAPGRGRFSSLSAYSQRNAREKRSRVRRSPRKPNTAFMSLCPSKQETATGNTSAGSSTSHALNLRLARRTISSISIATGSKRIA